MDTTIDNKNGILKTDALGRVCTGKARREAILDDFESSGMSGKAYARLHGIKYPTFAYWIQARRRKRGDYERKKSGKQARQPLALAEVVGKSANQ